MDLTDSVNNIEVKLKETEKKLLDKLDSFCDLFNEKFVTREEFSELKEGLTEMKSDIQKNTKNFTMLSARMDIQEEEHKDIKKNTNHLSALSARMDNYEQELQEIKNNTNILPALSARMDNYQQQQKETEVKQKPDGEKIQNKYLGDGHNRTINTINILKFGLNHLHVESAQQYIREKTKKFHSDPDIFALAAQMAAFFLTKTMIDHLKVIYDERILDTNIVNTPYPIQILGVPKDFGKIKTSGEYDALKCFCKVCPESSHKFAKVYIEIHSDNNTELLEKYLKKTVPSLFNKTFDTLSIDNFDAAFE